MNNDDITKQLEQLKRAQSLLKDAQHILNSTVERNWGAGSTLSVKISDQISDSSLARVMVEIQRVLAPLANELVTEAHTLMVGEESGSEALSCQGEPL